MSVSRAEYDAALKRVMDVHARDGVLSYQSITLAALGLDEPPPTAHNGIPDDFWREVPCGHPSDPVAARVIDGGWTCHCGGGLDPKNAVSDGTVEGAPGPIVPCGKCGCYVAIPRVEPPTETPKAKCAVCGSRSHDPCPACIDTETPKACPTCGGIGVWHARPGITPGGYCYRCDGTGETPKACEPPAFAVATCDDPNCDCGGLTKEGTA